MGVSGLIITMPNNTGTRTNYFYHIQISTIDAYYFIDCDFFAGHFTEKDRDTLFKEIDKVELLIRKADLWKTKIKEFMKW